MAVGTELALASRDRAVLRAVAAGRAELVRECGGIRLVVDGMGLCDQAWATQFWKLGLVAGVIDVKLAIGARVGARLTGSGEEALRALAG